VVFPLTPEMAASKSKQFRPNHRQEAVGCRAIAIPPTGQHFGNFACLHYTHSPANACWALILAKVGVSHRASIGKISLSAQCPARTFDNDTK
jgi:hypothetical protein